jgi:hypothetical protein
MLRSHRFPYNEFILRIFLLGFLMSNHFERVSAVSWIAIAALGVFVATAPLTLPANYQFLLTLIIYIVILRQIWFFVRSKARVAKLVWVLLGLLIIHNPLIASYLKSTQFWVMIIVYTGIVLLYLELRLILEQRKTPGEDS